MSIAAMFEYGDALFEEGTGPAHRTMSYVIEDALTCDALALLLGGERVEVRVDDIVDVVAELLGLASRPGLIGALEHPRKIDQPWKWIQENPPKVAKWECLPELPSHDNTPGKMVLVKLFVVG